jgi:signal transduction histidine kinase
MGNLKEWPRLLLTLPLGIRLSIVTLCTLLCIAIHILTFPDSHNGILLAIPIGLTAWMFKRRGLLTCSMCEVAIMVVYNTIRFGGLKWPLFFALFFWGGSLILLLAGYAIIALRNLVDFADAARMQAQQAEQQTVLAYQQQRQLNQLKNQFIMSVNHELRTPLTALYGYLELFNIVLRQDGRLDRTAHGPLLERALHNCEELGVLVNNILDTINLGSEGGPLVIDELSVSEVVTDVAAHFEAVQQSTHRLLIDIPAQIMVLANDHCFRHVLRHLLSNAFKYTPVNTRVIVSASLDSSDAQLAGETSQVCIRVKDEGPGIPQEELPLLFGQFVRLKRDLGGKVRGNGLGLYISKYLVEAMGGHIWVESEGIAGHGSLFCFTLPAAPHEAKILQKEVTAL